VARILGDVSAVKKGKVGKRIVRRGAKQPARDSKKSLSEEPGEFEDMEAWMRSGQIQKGVCMEENPGYFHGRSSFIKQGGLNENQRRLENSKGMD